jgi:sulfopyruvate decarboxylase subunit alpha
VTVVFLKALASFMLQFPRVAKMAKAELILQELKDCGVTHVIGLPDNSSATLLALLSEGSEILTVPVTREAEAFGVAAGLWIGGKAPLVLIQNTGLLESGDSFRGTVMRMRIPLVCLITYRGYSKRGGLRFDPIAEYLNAESLSRPDLDSAALITEPTLKAWGIPFDFLHQDTDIPKISDASKRARALSQPVAILITNNMG